MYCSDVALPIKGISLTKTDYHSMIIINFYHLCWSLPFLLLSWHNDFSVLNPVRPKSDPGFGKTYVRLSGTG